MKYASFGSVSTGTLRTADLLDAFADELEYQVQCNAELPLSHRESLLNMVWDAREIDPDHEDADEILNDLQDALQEFAPPYSYFGANEGDGADFGFWPSMESVEELPIVESFDEAKALGEDCRIVSDHGNVTVVGGDGKEIWSVV